MKIELIIKSARIKELSETDKEERKEAAKIKKRNRLIGLEDEEEGDDIASVMGKFPIEFSYRPYVLDSFDIIGFTTYDEGHTILLTDGHGDLVIKMGYDIWKTTYEYITGQQIKAIQEYTAPKIEIQKLNKLSK